MTANQIFRGVHWPSAASRIGFISACLAFSSACGGSIEETEVDRVHLINGSTGVRQEAAPTAASSTPARAPAATPPAATVATPPAATPPVASTTPPPAETLDPPPVVAPAELSFATDVYPIFTAKCGPCHTAGSSGGQSIGSADTAKALADSKAFKDSIVDTIETGDMPLGCAKPPGGGGTCLTVDEFETIQDWVEGGTPP